MKLTDEQIAAIRDGTEGVTPYVVFTDGGIHLRERDMNGIMPKIGHVKASKLVSHIARCDPDTIRALATEVLESRADIARLWEALALASDLVDGSLRKVERVEARVAELEALLDVDRLEEIITDSIDLDWTPRDAAKAIVRAMGGDKP
jgi:hypothetical protein